MAQSKWLGNVPDFIKNRQINTEWIGAETNPPHLVNQPGKESNYKTVNSTPITPTEKSYLGPVEVSRPTKPQLTRELNLKAKKSQTNSGITPNSGG